jgi:hypothetical protein
LSIALCFLGVLLATHNAFAGTWNAATVENAELLPSSSLLAGKTYFVYYIDPTTGVTYEGEYVKGIWQYGTVDSNGAQSTSPNTFGFYRLVAHSDWDNTLRLSQNNPFNPFVGWTVQVVDGANRLDRVSGDVASVVLNGKMYIFYEASQVFGSGRLLLFCAIWDGSHFTYQYLDGDGGGQGRVAANLSQPAAVKTPDGKGIRVYYHDDTHSTLREAFTGDGVNWTNFTALDGPGGYGPNKGAVGYHPSAILFNGTVNVFYGDQSNSLLRTAQLSNGHWSFSPVDTWDGGYNASVVHSGAMQVYYISNVQLRAAWGTGPYTFNWIPLDGPGGLANGALPGWVQDQVTALEFNNAPTVFYWMNAHGFCQCYFRNSYWQ